MKFDPHSLFDFGRGVWEAVWPGALGSLVGQMFEKGLSLQDRVGQWFVGLAFAVAVVPGIGHLFGWSPTLINAVGFVVGTFAFRAFPVLREAAIAGMAGGLRSIPEVFKSWTRRPGAAPEPPKPTEGEG